MQTEAFRHEHNFQALHEHGQKRSWQVLILTLIVMVVEIIAGTVYGSMALLADGWHMSTHAVAFIIVLAAYRYAHKHAHDPAFYKQQLAEFKQLAHVSVEVNPAFGPGKQQADKLIAPETV